MAAHAGRLETMRTAVEEKVEIPRERLQRSRPDALMLLSVRRDEQLAPATTIPRLGSPFVASFKTGRTHDRRQASRDPRGGGF
jgi:hypothetical protein